MTWCGRWRVWAFAAILGRIRRVRGLRLVTGPRGNGPASYHAIDGAAGTVGVVSPMSHSYCGNCNRMRLAADGQLRPCLVGDLHADLRRALRAGEALEPLIRHALAINPERHWLVRGSDAGSGGLRALSHVGGRWRTGVTAPGFTRVAAAERILHGTSELLCSSRHVRVRQTA